MIKSNTKTNYIILKKKREIGGENERVLLGRLLRNLILNVHSKRFALDIAYM